MYLDTLNLQLNDKETLSNLSDSNIPWKTQVIVKIRCVGFSVSAETRFL